MFHPCALINFKEFALEKIIIMLCPSQANKQFGNIHMPPAHSFTFRDAHAKVISIIQMSFLHTKPLGAI